MSRLASFERDGDYNFESCVFYASTVLILWKNIPQDEVSQARGL